ncbi:hypothetical protein AAMO2058_001429700 [Amorphochlora amoebiformis]
MTLARMYPEAIQLGQGYPDYHGCKVAREAASTGIMKKPSMNQYSDPKGTLEIRESLIRYYKNMQNFNLTLDQVTITTSGTEALWAGLNAICEPGDEVIIFEPYFPWYPIIVEQLGAKPVLVPLKPPNFAPDIKLIKQAITSKTRAMILNTPHNPTGHVYTKTEIEQLASVAVESDIFVISDEVYENVVWSDLESDQPKHRRIAEEKGMENRTITIGSASKLFSLTGWRVGWAMGAVDVIRKINQIHSYSTYCAATPLQHGVAVAFDMEDGSFEGIPRMIHQNYLDMSEACRSAGLTPYRADGGHFLIAGIEKLIEAGLTEMDVVKRLLEAGVSTLPLSMFASQSYQEKAIRIAICKSRETILEAGRRLKACDILS